MKDIENIFLDLDSNIIHSVVILDSSQDKSNTNKKNIQNRSKNYKVGISKDSSNNLKYYDYFDIEDKETYRIYLRPYLEEFLDYIFENYNVSVFTAADKPYALFIAENIINNENRKLEYVFLGLSYIYI